MLDDLYDKGLAMIVETPDHTLAIFNHLGKPSGVVAPKCKLSLQCKPPSTTIKKCELCETNACYFAVPCGHILFCENDSRDKIGTKCPMCEDVIMSCTRIIYSEEK